MISGGLIVLQVTILLFVIVDIFDIEVTELGLGIFEVEDEKLISDMRG